MGQGCSGCSVGNPCTDPECRVYGSGLLVTLLEQVHDKYEEVMEGMRVDASNEKWIYKTDEEFAERTTISPEGFKFYGNNIKKYFSEPQPTIDDLERVETRMCICLSTRKEGEYLECSSKAKELSVLADNGRDIPLQCKAREDEVACTYVTSNRPVSTDTTESDVKASKPYQPFGSCYA